MISKVSQRGEREPDTIVLLCVCRILLKNTFKNKDFSGGFSKQCCLSKNLCSCLVVRQIY